MMTDVVFDMVVFNPSLGVMYLLRYKLRGLLGVSHSIQKLGAHTSCTLGSTAGIIFNAPTDSPTSALFFHLLVLMVEIAVSVFASGEDQPISNKSAPNTQTEESRCSPDLAVLHPSQKSNQMDSTSQPPSVATVCWTVCYRIIVFISCLFSMKATSFPGDWDQIRALDEQENWSERNSVVSKQDHMFYTSCAKVGPSPRI